MQFSLIWAHFLSCNRVHQISHSLGTVQNAVKKHGTAFAVIPSRFTSGGFQNVEYKSSNALALEPLCSKISSGGSLKKVGPMVFVCLSMCQSILAPGARTAGLIATGEAPFHTLEQQKDDGINCGVMGATWHMPHANVPSLAKK